ncbi:MAG: M15 family metallopeptidase [Defluviitaleaceae bacterium]|nr:M15 family metallopeptidase [Defluviitaleaceae bacterium]
MRRRRYREPVFSGGFTAFLLVLILAGCGAILYVVMSGGFVDGIASLRPNGGYANEAGVEGGHEPSETVMEGNAGITDEREADSGQTPDDYTPSEGASGLPDDYINLLTYVDNSLLPWYLKLVNRYNFLDYYFYPQLVAVGGGHQFDARAYRALLDMLESARNYGLDPIIVSSFRSVSRQTYLFNRQVQRHIDAGYTEEEAFEAARRVVAYPGTSEHNLGLAVDIVSNSYHGLTARQAETPEGVWLQENSYRYGFVLRYPYYHQHITNIIFEPWHFRYVGVTAATEMFERGLVLEEFVSELLA